MPIRYVWKRIERFFIYRVLHVDDTPHRIALGLAVGIFMTWTPFIGLQMLLTVAVSALLRANKVVGVPFVWISNPATLVPIYYPNYLLGCLLLGRKPRGASFLLDTVSHGSFVERIKQFWSTIGNAVAPMLVGSFLVGLVLAVGTYFLTRYAVIRYRRFWHRRHPKPPWQEQEGPEDPVE